LIPDKIHDESDAERYIQALIQEATRWERSYNPRKALDIWETIFRSNPENSDARISIDRLRSRIAEESESNPAEEIPVRPGKRDRKRWALQFIVNLLAAIIISWSVFSLYLPRIQHDCIVTTKARSRTGIIVFPGQYRIRVEGAWNINTRSANPTDPGTRNVGPEGIPGYQLGNDRKWTYPDLAPLCTALIIGKKVLPACRDVTLELEQDWFLSSPWVKLELAINDAENGFADNGPGISPDGRVENYFVWVERLQ
jgi:hypothetical protein